MPATGRPGVYPLRNRLHAGQRVECAHVRVSVRSYGIDHRPRQHRTHLMTVNAGSVVRVTSCEHEAYHARTCTPSQTWNENLAAPGVTDAGISARCRTAGTRRTVLAASSIPQRLPAAPPL